MAENSAIEWTDHTFNPWIGCTEVSPACDNCYAREMAEGRYRWATWGAGEPRRRTSADNWKKPLSWDRKAAAAGTRARVFCASLADVFDAEVPDEWRDELLGLIGRTPHLDWLLLTKRPKVAHTYLSHPRARAAFEAPRLHPRVWPIPNLWLGTTVESQAMAEARIPWLLMAPARVRFLSCEPLLGPVDLTRIKAPANGDPARTFTTWDSLRGTSNTDHPIFGGGGVAPGRIDCVICGGESGPKARPFDAAWARDLLGQCSAAGTAFFMKQMGGRRRPLPPIPADLMVRELPVRTGASPAPFRCGDVVEHVPSGERWVVAWCEGDDLAPCGWPDGIARTADCRLVKAADDHAHRSMVRSWADSSGHGGDSRRARVLRLYGHVLEAVA